MTEKQIIYSMHKVGKVYRQKTVLKDISLSYFYGAKIGVLGNNGSGKSTLLRIMAGVEDDYLGTTTMSKGHRVGFLEQSPRLEEEKTVLETVKEGAKETVQLLAQFEEISAKFADPLEEEEMNQLLQKQAQLQDRLDAVNAWDLDSRLELAMNALGCPPPDALCEKLSGGEKRRVALCRLLLEEPDILLLDEPTNHLDAQTVWWLEKHLQQYKGTVIAVTHDRYFLDNVAGWILELDRGEGIPFQGNYSAWLTTKAKRLATEEKRESKRQKAMAEELDWIRSSPSARRSKNKARIKNYQTRVKESRQKYQETGEIYIPPGPRLGEMVISAQNVTMAFGDKTLFSNLNFTLPAGGIVGVIGPNGAGKSTLFRLMAKELTPLEGSFKVGETVDLSFVDQDRDLPLNETILQAVTDGQDFLTIDGREVNARAYLARYNFSGEEQKKTIGELSGGELSRVHLACILKSEGNVLLLDEPTNDLDVNTLRALEKALVDFAGCAVVISHDRYFLDRIATHILSFEEEGKPFWFDGNFSDYELDLKNRLGDDPLAFRRQRHKKLKRD